MFLHQEEVWGESLRDTVTREWDSGAGRAGPEKLERVSFPPLCLVPILLPTEGSVWSRNVLSSLTVFLELSSPGWPQTQTNGCPPPSVSAALGFMGMGKSQHTQPKCSSLFLLHPTTAMPGTKRRRREEEGEKVKKEREGRGAKRKAKTNTGRQDLFKA